MKLLHIAPVVMLLAALVLSPWSHASPTPQVLRLLVWEGYAPELQAEKFKTYIDKKYDVDLTMEIDYVSEPSQFYDAVRGMKADIIAPTHNLIKDERFDYIGNRLILPVDLDHLPNYRGILPSLKHADYITQDGRVYGTPFAVGSYGLAYNTQQMDPPDSWEVFWEPESAGKYTISVDYYEVNIYITALAMGYRGEELYSYEALNNPDFKARLNDLVKNADSMWRGVDKADDLQGLSLAAIWGFSLHELKQRGEAWAMARPREGSMTWVDNLVIGYSLRDKPLLKRIAEEWLNFSLSPEFQAQVVVRDLGSEPVSRWVTSRLTPQEIAKYHLDAPDFLRESRVLWPTIRRVRDRNGMKNLWKQALKQ